MYISAAILAVPAGNQSEYETMAKTMSEMFMDHGAIETMDAWEDDVPDGKRTDFRKAVAAEDGEKIVFSWIVWPDKAACDRSWAIMDDDPRVAEMGAMPFDGKRMIFGGFTPLVSTRK